MWIRFEASQLLAALGALVLIGGLFLTPIVQIDTTIGTLTGQIELDYFDFIDERAYNLLMVALVGFALALSGWTRPLPVVGLAALGIAANDLRLMMDFTAQERLFFSAELAWGWGVLFVGALIMMATPLADRLPFPRLYQPSQITYRFDRLRLSAVALLGIVLLCIGVFLPLYQDGDTLAIAAERIGQESGTVNLFYGGDAFGIHLLVLAGVALIALALRYDEGVALAGLIALGILLNEFRLGSAKADIFENFGIAWLFLAGGVFLMLGTWRLLQLSSDDDPAFAHLDRLKPAEKLLQNGFPVVTLGFLGGFIFSEFDGIESLIEFIWNALISIPNFIEEIITYFGSVPAGALVFSMLVGGIFGACSTALFLLSARGYLKLPSFSGRTLLITLISWALFFYVEGTFWTALAVALVVLFVVSLFNDESMRVFLSPQNLKPLRNPRALQTLVVALGLGAAIGAAGAQILMYPMEHCVYNPNRATLYRDFEPVQFRIGLGITVAGAFILLLPAWTLLSRRKSSQQQSTGGYFRHPVIPYLFLAPTLIFLAVFLYYPASQIVPLSLSAKTAYLDDARPVCLQNYVKMVDGEYQSAELGGEFLPGNIKYANSFSVTLMITAAIVAVTMATALGIAVLASQKIRGAGIYRTLLVWPYALSPIVTGVIFLTMFRDGGAGIINYGIDRLYEANLPLMRDLITSVFGSADPAWIKDETLSPWVIVYAAVWNALGFNILFYIAGLQNVPKDLLEAAAIDGANVVNRFFRITLPLLSPFTFFLLVANVTYSFYGIYGAVDIMTNGGPPLGPGGIQGGATDVLIFKLYEDGFKAGGPAGFAAAQAMLLFLMVAGLTLFQFAFVERRVTYAGD